MKKLFLGLFFSLMAMNTFAGNKISVSSVSVAPGKSTTVTVSADVTSDNIWSLDFSVQLPEGLYIPKAGGTTEGDYSANFTVDATWNNAFWTEGTEFDWATATWNFSSYAATFKSTGTTICAESALNFSSVSGAKLYAVSEITSTAAKLTQIEDGIADAGQGYLVMGLSGDQKIPFTESTSSYTGVNLLKGVTAPTAIASDAKIYVFSDGEFHPCSGGTLAAGKAYLDCSGVEGLAKTIFIDFDDTTGIGNISSDEDASNAPIYNLSGMRVQKAQKGVYIRNGKKYVVE